MMETGTHTPEELMDLASEGRFSKDELVALLAIERRQAFLDACARIERKFTEDCAAQNHPCLQSGCSIDAGEICLQPLLRAGSDYYKACAQAWLPIFQTPANRAGAQH